MQDHVMCKATGQAITEALTKHRKNAWAKNGK